MRKRKQGRKFHRTASVRQAFLYSITENLFRVGRIKTTEARAKEARRVAERAITTGKNGTLAARRRLEAQFSAPVARKVFSELSPKYAKRPGGYTRIIKLGSRKGDRAPMVYLELVDNVKSK